MKARDIIHNFRDYYQSMKSSCAYNPREQDQAIKSAENQISIADNTVKSAASNLTNRVDALRAAVDRYFSRMSELGTTHFEITKDSKAHQIANSASFNSHDQSIDSSVSQLKSTSQANSVSSASNSSSSTSQVLVSLKNSSGVIYSLVNKKI